MSVLPRRRLLSLAAACAIGAVSLLVIAAAKAPPGNPGAPSSTSEPAVLAIPHTAALSLPRTAVDCAGVFYPLEVRIEP